MYRKSVARPFNRNFLKLSLVSIKKAYHCKKYRKLTKMAVSQVVYPPKLADSRNDSISNKLKIPVSINKDTTRQNKYSSNDARKKIESLLLEQWQKLFSTVLPRCDVERLVKQSALEIASNLGIEKRKFKGTKKWLKTFLKRCELLGYVTVSDKVNDAEKIDVGYNKPGCGITKQTATFSEISLQKSNHQIPDICHLFSTPGLNSNESNDESSPTNGLFKQEQNSSRVTELIDLFAINPALLPCKPPAAESSEIFSEYTDQFRSFACTNLQCTCEQLPCTIKENIWVDSCSFLPTEMYSIYETGVELARNVFDVSVIECSEDAPGVYDELFSLFRTAAVESEKHEKLPYSSIDSTDSGYGSQSIKSPEENNFFVPTRPSKNSSRKSTKKLNLKSTTDTAFPPYLVRSRTGLPYSTSNVQSKSTTVSIKNCKILLNNVNSSTGTLKCSDQSTKTTSNCKYDLSSNQLKSLSDRNDNPLLSLFQSTDCARTSSQQLLNPSSPPLPSVTSAETKNSFDIFESFELTNTDLYNGESNDDWIDALFA